MKALNEMNFAELQAAASDAENAGDIDALALIDDEMMSRPEMQAAIEAIIPVTSDGSEADWLNKVY